MIFVFLQSRHYGQCRYLIRIYITVFSEPRTSPNVTGIVLFYFRYVEFWWKSLYYAELYQQIIVSGQRTISNHQYPLIIRNQDERNIMKT